MRKYNLSCVKHILYNSSQRMHLKREQRSNNNQPSMKLQIRKYIHVILEENGHAGTPWKLFTYFFIRPLVNSLFRALHHRFRAQTKPYANHK